MAWKYARPHWRSNGRVPPACSKAPLSSHRKSRHPLCLRERTRITRSKAMAVEQRLRQLASGGRLTSELFSHRRHRLPESSFGCAEDRGQNPKRTSVSFSSSQVQVGEGAISLQVEKHSM